MLLRLLAGHLRVRHPLLHEHGREFANKIGLTGFASENRKFSQLSRNMRLIQPSGLPPHARNVLIRRFKCAYGTRISGQP